MSFPIIRYPLDPTGLSLNNFVQGEEHVLGVKAGPYHPLAPFYGPYYNSRDTLTVYAGTTLLEYQVDYWSTNLIQDATARFSGEVCELIIVKNRTEGEVITLNYQNVGGLFQNHAKGLVDMYNAFLADNRPVDWVTGVRNKPTAYPPSYHLHLLSDVVGWESLIVAIERLINALTLRNVPAFEALIDWVMARVLETVSEEEIRNAQQVDKFVTLRRLLFANKTLNFNAITFRTKIPSVRQGNSFDLTISSTNFPAVEVLYWTIEHIDTEDNMFVSVNGSVTVNDQEGSFRIPTLIIEIEGNRLFKVHLRRNSVTGPILSTSRTLELKLKPIFDIDYGLLINSISGIPTTQESHLVWKTPESMFLIQDDYFYEVSNVTL